MQLTFSTANHHCCFSTTCCSSFLMSHTLRSSILAYAIRLDASSCCTVSITWQQHVLWRAAWKLTASGCHGSFLSD